MIRKRKSSKTKKDKDYYSYSVYKIKQKPEPKRRPNNVISATLILIILNVLIFFFLMIFGFFENQTECVGLCKYIALQPASILQGNYLWTIITSMFMHGGIMHLFVNMLSLFFLGSFLERLIGKKKFIIFYFVSGIIASLFFALFAIQPFNLIPGIRITPESFAVGASGAIFGLGGLLAILTPKVPVYLMFIPIPMPLWFGIILMFGLMWFATIAIHLPVGNAAHLGGLIVGLIYGFYLRVHYRKKVAKLDKYFRFRR